MEIIGEGLTWNSDIMGVVSYLVRIHHGGRYFDWAREVEEIIAQVVGELLNLYLRHVGPVCDNVVVHGQCSGDCCLVSDHVEVEACLVAWVFDQTLIDDCAWCRVLILVAALFREPSIDSFVD